MADPEETISDLREQLIEVVLREAAAQALSGNAGKLRQKLFDAVDKQAEVAAREALGREGGITLSPAEIDRIADAVALRLGGRSGKRGQSAASLENEADAGSPSLSPSPATSLLSRLGALLEKPAVQWGLGGLLLTLGALLAWFLWLKPDPVNPPRERQEVASPPPTPQASTVSCRFAENGLEDCETSTAEASATATPAP